jgi:fumarate reductase iron-sulfur subunit
MTSPAALRVFRWTADQAERVDEYRVTAAADTPVLDALVEIQRTQDPTLAFRYACRVGMCGSCAMVVNGRERWACRTRLESLGPGPISVRPLYHFPLLRDLVVDMTPFAAKLRDVSAALTPREGAPPYALVASGSTERQEIDLAIECIGCGMCVSACTMVGHNDRFPGPAALNRALTLELDHRDGGREGRGAFSWATTRSRCHGQGNCTRLSDEPLAGRFDSPASSARRATVVRSVGLIRLADLTSPAPQGA